jgi:NADH-quinone oxidoreductase subunit E
MRDFKVDHNQYAKEGIDVRFSPESLARIRILISRYPEGKQKSALLPVLHMAQEELGGYLTVDVMDHVADLLKIQPVEVYEVATFYTQFLPGKKGKYLIEVCRTAPCAICGGEKISGYLQEKLGIKSGETTADGLFTIKEVECLGACGYAPAMQINMKFYEKLTEEKIDGIIDDLSKRGDDQKQTGSKWADELF